MTVNAVRIQTELIRVDTRRADEDVEARLLLGDLGEDLLGLLEAPEIAPDPLDVGLATCLLLELGDSLVALLLLAVDEDYSSVGLDESSGDLRQRDSGSAGTSPAWWGR